jgi:tartrate dehydrogenase/decarboxylase / D-malate dehydrogenase
MGSPVQSVRESATVPPIPSAPTRLAKRRSGDIDFHIVRQVTEGEHSSVGRRMFDGTGRETLSQETILTSRPAAP